jgi:ornithine carbamoyltransferase
LPCPRNVVATGMMQLGGCVSDLPGSLPSTGRAADAHDIAKVLSRCGDGIAIRNTQWQVGHEFISEVARHSAIPVTNLGSDMRHPTQAMADLMTLREVFGIPLGGLKLTCSWAYSVSYTRPLSVPQSLILLMTRLGVHVTLAHPPEFGLMPDTVAKARRHAEASGGALKLTDDINQAFEGANAVYPVSWACAAEACGVEGTRQVAEKYSDWTCNAQRMDLADSDAVYMHCLPADKGFEVTEDVIGGPRSVVFDQAENRLHLAKAVLAMTL